MLKDTDIKEIAKRLNKNDCSITRMAGVYVNTNKEKVCTMNQNFLSLSESVFYKYLAIAKGIFGKKIDDNMLSVPFAQDTGKKMMQNLIAEDFNVKDHLEEFFDRIIENYPYCGNYLILLWLDAYDIPRRGTDGLDQDESEEVYKYLMGAICPVELTAAGLQYDESMNNFCVRERDWVVGKPSAGFIYPSFEEREVEREKALYYTAHPVEPMHDFMEAGLGLQPVITISEMQDSFKRVLRMGLGSREEAERQLPYIGRQIHILAMDDEEEILTGSQLEEICLDIGISGIEAKDIMDAYTELFANPPKASYLLNKAAIRKIEELQSKEEWKRKCKEAAVAIERLSGEKTDLSQELREMAARK